MRGWSKCVKNYSPRAVLNVNAVNVVVTKEAKSETFKKPIKRTSESPKKQVRKYVQYLHCVAFAWS